MDYLGFPLRSLQHQFKIATKLLVLIFLWIWSLIKCAKELLISIEIETFDRLRSGLNSFTWRTVVSWIITQNVVSTCEEYILYDSVLQKNYCLLIK